MASSIPRAVQPAGTRTAVGAAGLNAGEVRRRLLADGPNTLPSPRPPSPLMLLVRQLTHFFALMLWIAAALAVVGGMRLLGVAIGIVVVINGGFAFAQEYRADQAGQRLRDLLPVRVTVVRDGSRQEVLPVTDPDGRDLTISCGVALHHLVVALGHAGHDAYVKRMPDPQDNTHLATITISDAPPDPATARLFGAIGRRHTELRRMRCQPVPVALQAALVDAAHRFDVRMVRANGVREAFNSAFAAAAEHELWTNGHTTALHISGSPDSRIVDPRPGRTGLSDSRGFGYSELEVHGPPLGHRLPDDGAEFFLLATSEDRTQDRLRAGEALSSVLLTATQAGLATTPLSRGHDTGTHHPAVDETATPQIFVRVGWPAIRASAQSPSVRRDLATVLMRPVDSGAGVR